MIINVLGLVLGAGTGVAVGVLEHYSITLSALAGATAGFFTGRTVALLTVEAPWRR